MCLKLKVNISTSHHTSVALSAKHGCFLRCNEMTELRSEPLARPHSKLNTKQDQILTKSRDQPPDHVPQPAEFPPPPLCPRLCGKHQAVLSCKLARWQPFHSAGNRTHDLVLLHASGEVGQLPERICPGNDKSLIVGI